MHPTTRYIALPGSDGGDHHALFTSLFRTYGARIFFYFKKYLKRDELAEDLLQELFANLWNKRDSLLKEKSIVPYLFVSARNLLYNHLKLTVAREAPLSVDELPFSYQHIEEAIDYKEMQTAYHEVLSSLPPQRRKAFMLSREQGLSYQEIALQMDISPRTVEKHISEALRLLRDKIGLPYTVCFLFIFW